MSQNPSRAVPALAFIGLLLAFLVAAGAAVAAGPAVAALAQGDRAAATPGAAALRAKYEAIRPQLERNQFGRPLYLVSEETGHDLKGEVFGIVEHPFELASAALAEAPDWCNVLILPFNTKQCSADNGRGLTLYVGKKNHESIERAYRLDFAFNPVARSNDYLKRVLKSDSGPLGTRNYEITLEAAPLDARRTLIRLAYGYSYGTISKLAMQTYLATVGASKVGFSTTEEGGTRQLVGGMRGVMERNTMRYYLAIDAYLNSLSAPPEQQLEKRLNEWYGYSEKYRRQLWEMDRGEYLAMKRVETQAQRVARAPS
jgi:hypothetical protein